MTFMLSLFVVSACSYNPFISNNHTTGSAASTIVGAGIGAGGIGLMGGSKTLMVLGGLGGGALGYYFSTLTYDAGGITRFGGKVYKVGDFVGIYIPSDQLFMPNTTDFLPQAPIILNSIVSVLSRYPENNILISGNTSGFGRPRWEQKLSEKRAERVASYLWDAGINQFVNPGIDTRRLTYVGYGDYFPIAHHYTNPSIRSNSRIQITSYPSSCDLGIDRSKITEHNIGNYRDQDYNGCFDGRGKRSC